MTDSSSSSQINIGQGGKGIIGQTVTDSTYIEHQTVITPEAIDLQPFQARSPYKALKRFDVDDVDYFFGRYQLTLELQAALKVSNLILVLGASGSGKSSVVRAKLIPEFLGTSDKRHNFVMTPKENPFQSLYESFIGRDQVGRDKDYCFSAAKAQFVLAGKADVLMQVVRQLKDEDSEWLIFIDQFEELFTRCTNLEQRKNFLQSLTQMAESKDRSVKLVLAMRADFLEEFSPYPRFGQLVQRQIHLVTNMPEDELELAIKGPAAKHGVRFEPGLTKEIIQDVQGQAGSLPLMQYTLDRLWKYEVDVDGLTDRTLNTQNYRVLGKVRGALEKHVNEIYEALGGEGGKEKKPERMTAEQKAVKRIFLSLVKLVKTDGVIRLVSRSTVRSELLGEAVQETINRLINENLLVGSSRHLSQAALPVQAGKQREQQATIEIAHEILLSSWKLLEGWIGEAKEILLLKSRLVEDMGRWHDQKQANEELLKGSALEKVLEFKKEQLFELQAVPLSAAEETYLDASLRFQKRELNRAQRVAVGASIGVVFMAIATLFSAMQARQAEIEQIQTSVALSTAKLANDQTLEAAIASIRAGKVLQRSFWQQPFWSAFLSDSRLRMPVLGQLQQMANTGQERHRLEGHQGFVHSVVFSPDGKQLATTEEDGTARLWDTNGKPLATLKGHKGRADSVVFSPDGKQLATRGGDGIARLWDTNGKPLVTLEGHQGFVASVVFSPDGKQLATSEEAGTARLWDTNGRPLATLKGYQGRVASVVFSPDGKQLATRGGDGIARLWDTNGKPLATLKGHQGGVVSMVFSPDGKQLATRGADGTARLWDTNGKPLATLKGYQGSVASVVFSPDGKQLATTEEDGTVRLWDTNGKPLATLKGHQGSVASVVFSPDGKQLATTEEDGTARLWDTNGKPLATLKGHQGSVASVVFSPDGKQLATTEEDGTVRLWDTNGKPLVTLEGHQGSVDSVVFSPDGKQLATRGVDGTARLWDTNGKQLAPLKGHQGSVYSVVFSPDGKQLATRGADSTARLWDTNGKQLATLKGHQGRVASMVFSPDGKQLATSGEDGTARLWDTNGKQLATLKGHQGFVWSVVFSPNGQQLATSGEDGTARLWDTNGKQLATLKGHQGFVYSVVFSPDGKHLATSGVDGTARLWDTNGKQLATLEGHQESVDSVVFSPDGKQLATRGADGTARLWDTNGRQLATLKGYQGSFASVVFSPDGKQLASTGGESLARLWDTNGKQLAPLKGHQGFVYSVVFSPDGKQLATSGDDGTARLWDTNGKQLATLKGHQGSVASVVFSPDGKQLATSGDDGTARLWQVGDMDELLSKECDWVRDYLKSSPNVTESDRHLCDGIGSQK